MSDEKKVTAAILKLGKSDHNEAVPLLLEVLKSAPRASGNNEAERLTKTLGGRLSLAALESLGQLGPKAAEAVPFLLSENFFLIKGGYTSKNKPLRMATINTLIKIGKPAVPQVVEMLSMPNGRNHFRWQWWGKEILQQMATDPELADAIVEAVVQAAEGGTLKGEQLSIFEILPPAAEEEAIRAMGAQVIQPILDAIAKAGADDMTMNLGIRQPKAIKLYLKLRQMDKILGGNEVMEAIENALAAYSGATEEQGIKTAKDHESPNKVWKKQVMLIDALAMLGEKSVPALIRALDNDRHRKLLFDRLGPNVPHNHLISSIAEHGSRSNSDFRFYYSLGLCVGSDAEMAKQMVGRLATDEHAMVGYLSMVLDRMAPASIDPVAVKLRSKESDWYGRWAAAGVLELMGPKAKQAAPTLKLTLADEKEDLAVRVAAAKALARIQGMDVFDLLQQIPNVEERILSDTHAKALAWRKAYAAREGTREVPDSDWGKMAWLPHAICGGGNIEIANQELKKCAERGSVGSFMDVNMVRAFMACYSKSEYFPGRLYPDTEAAMKEYFFKHGKYAMSAKELRENAKKHYGKINTNIPINFSTRYYLSLGVLKDDPEYRNRKFKEGDTVIERYEAWNEFFKEFLKFWALNGLWVEHASSNYEYHTYPSYFNLADFAPDPVVRQRARMFLDLALIEREQITISHLRGGSKSRAKKGGLGSSFNPYVGLLYGERGSISSHSQISTSGYMPPDAAVLLRKFGPTTPHYEIHNTHWGGKGPSGISRAYNYAYCTPEYIIGAATYDPNVGHGKNTLGQWSGVIFRDLAAISMDAYTGEKWCVQDKDALILQRCTVQGYSGWPKINFESGFEKVEKDGWIFVNNGEAFAGVKVVAGGYFWGDPIKRTLYLGDQLSPVIIQTGTLKDYNSFAAFQEAICKAQLDFKDDTMFYQGPGVAKLELTCITAEQVAMDKQRMSAYNQAFDAYCKEIEKTHGLKIKERIKSERISKGAKPWSGVANQNYKKEIKAIAAPLWEARGMTPPIPDYPLPQIQDQTIKFGADQEYVYRSPYMERKQESEVVTVRYGERTWIYDFSRNSVSEL
ncbi:MAG: HEAT repeat domain-containing protein [Verrucomicrobiota bacterium]